MDECTHNRADFNPHSGVTRCKDCGHVLDVRFEE